MWHQTIDFTVQFGKIYRISRISSVSELFSNSSKPKNVSRTAQGAPFYLRSSACGVLVRLYYFLTFFRTIYFRKQLFSLFFSNNRSNFPFFLYLIVGINIFIFSQMFSNKFFSNKWINKYLFRCVIYYSSLINSLL